MLELYKEGSLIPGSDLQEVPYRFQRIGWEEFEKMVNSTGNRHDPWNTPLFRRGVPGEFRPILEELQPWPEAGRGEDIAGAALYLASEDARFVTGTALVVDGGLLAAGPRLGARLRELASRPGDSVGVDRGTTGLGGDHAAAEPMKRRK